MLRSLVVSSLLIAGLSIAACGAGSHPAPAQSTLTSGDRGMISFTRCVRTHGVAIADPYHRTGHAGLTLDLPTPGPAALAAEKVCGHFIASIVALKEAHQRTLTAPDRVALVRYAQCMRSRGIAMLDPDAQGVLNLGRVPGINNAVGRYTPQFRGADRACRAVLPASVPDDGTGP